MSEQLPELPQSVTETTTEQLPLPTKEKKPAKRFSIVRLEKRLSATFSIVTRAFVIAFIVIAAIFIGRELSDSGYVITQINVPAAFEEAGYTGPVVAKRISNQLNEIIRVTRSAEMAEEYASAADQSDVSIDMVGLGVPVRSFIELIGNAVGISRKKKITADITATGGQLILVLNITGEVPERFQTPLDTNLETPLKALVLAASEEILRYTNDRVLSRYYANYLRDGEKIIRLAKFRLEKFRGNVEVEARSYASWATGLVVLGKLDAAEQKVKQGLAINSTEVYLYSAWAKIFEAKGDHVSQIAMEKKAYSLLPADATNSVKATALGNIGVGFSFNNQSDSAIRYYQKALELDVEDGTIYYNLSYEYLIAGDTVRCLDEVERALIYGVSTTLMIQDPDMTGLLNHPRMKELLLKYGE